MSIKMIVTDLDGTFYHHDLTYNKEWFQKLYLKMQEQNIHFVVASGNQYYQLISFFYHPQDMTFIAENGGYIVHKGKELFLASIKQQTYHQIIHILKQHTNIPIQIICGKRSAYVNDLMTEKDFQIFLQYFPKMQRVKDFYEIDDDIIKIALMTSEEEVDEIAHELSQAFGESLRVVTSGHGCIDLMISDIHKGFALQKIMQLLDIEKEEVMAFGDANNDLEMLTLAGYGFVMKNGTEEMKRKIKRVCEYSNEEDGEFKIIEEYFDNPKRFLEKYK